MVVVLGVNKYLFYLLQQLKICLTLFSKNIHAKFITCTLITFSSFDWSKEKVVPKCGNIIALREDNLNKKEVRRELNFINVITI